MSSELEFPKVVCNEREHLGSRESNKLRKNGFVPIVMYGHEFSPVSLYISFKEINSIRKKNGGIVGHLFGLMVNETLHYAILKEVQRNVVSDDIIHIDFQKIDPSVSSKSNVEIRFVGKDNCEGVNSGGTMKVALSIVPLFCSPLKVPRFIEVDVSKLAVSSSICIGDIKLPEGVSLDSSANVKDTVVSVFLPVASVTKEQ